MSDLCREMEKLGKGIGNAVRYHILEVLSRGPRHVGGLAKAVGRSQPVVSQHLKALKAYGLVTSERAGSEMRYALNSEYMLGLLHALTKDIQKQKGRTR